MRLRLTFFCLQLGFLVLLPAVLKGQADDDTLCAYLRMAAFDGDSATVSFFLNTSEVDIDCFEPGETNALGYAVQEGHYSIAELLLMSGASPNGARDIEITPLNLAVIYDRFDIAEMLILYGASVDQRDAAGLTPLINAVSSGNLLMMDMLLHYGADPNITLMDNSSPLHVAALYGDLQAALLLLQDSADVNGADDRGITPLMVAASQDDTLFGRILLEAGAQPALLSRQGWNALAYAIHQQSYGMIQLLTPLESKPLSRDLQALILMKRDRISIKSLKAMGLFIGPKPRFISYHASFGISIGDDALMNYYTFGAHDFRYNTVVSLGFQRRNNPALVYYYPTGNDSLVYHMQGKRAKIQLGIEKRFNLFQIDNEKVVFTLALNPGYSWGSYAGSETKPWQGFLVEYATGLLVDKYWFSYGLKYQYHNFHDQPVSPHRLAAFFSLQFRNTKYKLKPKTLPYELSNQ